MLQGSTHRQFSPGDSIQKPYRPTRVTHSREKLIAMAVHGRCARGATASKKIWLLRTRFDSRRRLCIEYPPESCKNSLKSACSRSNTEM